MKIPLFICAEPVQTELLSAYHCTVQFLYKKSCLLLMCACACKYVESIIWKRVGCSLPRQAETQSLICPGSRYLETRWLIENQLNPTLKHTGPVTQQYSEASSRLCVWWQSLCDERWHFDSVSKTSWQPCGCTYQMYSHLFVWGEMKHAAGDYIQTISFYKLPCSIAPLKVCLWQNSQDPINAEQ